MDEVDGGDAVTGGEHAVVGGGRAAALGVAEVDGAGFVAGALFDFFGEDLADARESDVAEGVDFRADGGLAGVFGEFGSFGDDDDGEALAALPAGAEEAGDVVEVDGVFGGEDDVGSAGDAGGDGDPAGVAAHDFDDLDAGVGFAGGVEAVDGFGGDGDGGVEAEAGVGAGEVVVDGLGDADAVYSALGEFDGDGLGVVAAHGDEGVEFVSGNDFEAALEAAFDFFDVGAGGAKDGAAAVQDAGGGLEIKRQGAVVDHAAPAFEEADEFVTVVEDAFAHDGANDGVESRTISTTGKHSDTHCKPPHRLENDSARRGEIRGARC